VIRQPSSPAAPGGPCASAAAARAAVSVAAAFGVTCARPAVLSDGANVVVHLSPSPVVAKVAATTAVIRPDAAAWLRRELDVAVFLTQRGAPVLAPSSEVPATIHQAGGHVMSFWRYRKPSGTELADEAAIRSMLRDLHGLLRTYPAAVPMLAPLCDIPAFLARPRVLLGAADTAALTAAYARITADLDPASCAGQVLHGDAGVGNLMCTDTGWLWHDFEDICSGPVAWDLAASTANRRLESSRILTAYGEPVDASQLALCQQLRRLHLTIWYALYAERLPQHAQRAGELLASWPAP
jgi:Ser/Thr protein kinase RdoA (MazF antagonist)